MSDPLFSVDHPVTQSTCIEELISDYLERDSAGRLWPALPGWRMLMIDDHDVDYRLLPQSLMQLLQLTFPMLDARIHRQLFQGAETIAVESWAQYMLVLQQSEWSPQTLVVDQLKRWALYQNPDYSALLLSPLSFGALERSAGESSIDLLQLVLESWGYVGADGSDEFSERLSFAFQGQVP